MKHLIIALVCFSTSMNSFSQSFSSLVAFVTDKDSGQPISSASVIIKEAGWATKTTGNDGKAFFDKSMPIGEIHYIISKEGYQGIEGAFNITTEEKSNTLNIKLSKFRDDMLLITGEVVDENDRDLEGALVEVKVADIVRTAKTDASGNYKIELALNKSKYDVSTLKLEAKCANGTGKKTETIDLTRRNVIYKDFKVSCSAKTTPSNNPSQIKGYLKFELVSCTQSGTEIECLMKITSNDRDIDLSMVRQDVRIITQSSNEFEVAQIRLGDKVSWGNAWTAVKKNLVIGIPVNCYFVFKGVNEDVKLIPKFETHFSSGDLGRFQILFRNINL